MLQQAITNPASAQEARNQPPGVPTILRAVYCGFANDPDAALVSSFRAGDALAFDLLVKRHQRRLVNVALRITRNREDAEDVVQDSFLNAFRRLDSFRGDSRFLSWLTRITINQALMTVRAKPRMTTSLDQRLEGEQGVITCETKSGGYTPEQICSQLEFERLLLNWTAGMKEASRQVLELRAIGLKEDEIAQVLGLSLSAAKTRLFRARRELRKRMEWNVRSTRAPRTAPISKSPSAETPISDKRKYDRDQLSVWIPGTLSANDAFTHAAANAG